MRDEQTLATLRLPVRILRALFPRVFRDLERRAELTGKAARTFSWPAGSAEFTYAAPGPLAELHRALLAAGFTQTINGASSCFWFREISETADVMVVPHGLGTSAPVHVLIHDVAKSDETHPTRLGPGWSVAGVLSTAEQLIASHLADNTKPA